jgi:hypothetical protein
MPQQLDENEFYGSDLLDALQAEGLRATIEHTGGGTATMYVDNSPNEETLVVGPGYFGFGNTGAIFDTGDLHYSLDVMNRDGETYRAEDPEMFTIEPGTPLPEVVRLIAAKYRELNP